MYELYSTEYCISIYCIYSYIIYSYCIILNIVLVYCMYEYTVLVYQFMCVPPTFFVLYNSALTPTLNCACLLTIINIMCAARSVLLEAGGPAGRPSLAERYGSQDGSRDL